MTTFKDLYYVISQIKLFWFLIYDNDFHIYIDMM